MNIKLIDVLAGLDEAAAEAAKLAQASKLFVIAPGPDDLAD